MLIELLRRGAEEAPERPAVISPKGSLSYAEALARSNALATGLAARDVARVGVVLEDPGDVLVVLAAASAIGVEPCVYPRDLTPDALARLAARLGHGVLVVDERPALPDEVDSVTLDELPGDGPIPDQPERAPVMILTTGTTGEQKGVRHDWSRLVRAVRAGARGDDSRWLLAYNLNQFAGIQVLLHVLASGTTLVAPRSSQARDVIEAMRSQRVSHVSATPTFWRLLVGRLDAESASELALEQITLGGEAAPAPVIEKLRALFPGARISHVYAGTEFGSVVSVTDAQAGLPVSVLERGEDADVQLRIVAGELEIRSRVGMLGYHEGADAGDEWRPTGDLVEVRGDRIHFVGRTSEIINVGGAKVHPLPIEELVGAVPGVALVAAYGRSNPITGQLVALDVVAEPGADQEAVERAIREATTALPRPGRPRTIRFVDSLEVQGHKVLRRAKEEE
jgi:acyl-CoA synthetase (AMP-forming)/AMP-acid ligase II